MLMRARAALHWLLLFIWTGLARSLARVANALTPAQRAASERDFTAWLAAELETAPNRETYADLYAESAAAVVRWRRRFHGNPKLWQRLAKERLVKEVVECAPVVAATRDFVAARPAGAPPVTIVDLCSGKGYLSMLLSELLPADRVARCVMVDKAWPLCDQAEPLPHQINWDHVYGNHTSIEGVMDYFESWPITLTTSKQDLKCRSSVKGMVKHVFDRAPGDVVVLAVHLCGTLSLKALDVFNAHPKCKFLALKPCCLPHIIHANRGESFSVGGHSFDAAEVCSAGKFKGNKWIGPPRHALRPKFDRWAGHLLQGVNVREGGAKSLEHSLIQTDGGYQNSFVFAEHGAATTERLWTGIKARRMPSHLPGNWVACPPCTS
mmetsp:Transcript_24548/g.73679  ORF Transcript_24548/g.73679 Transcript_24548/m.73679 type:complete len:380 (-) Transcript_24548:16-1155(-)